LSSAGCGGSSCPNALDFTQSCDSMYIAVVMP
jgi:hypothetical protein